MSDNDQEEVFRPDAFWSTPSSPMASDMINAAIETAATTPIGGLGANQPEAWTPRLSGFAQGIDAFPRGGVESPPVADAILLDILPVSTVSSDGLGRAQIAPDAPSLNAWSRTDRETAEHLISWVNESGTARDAIAKAITGGSDRFERLSIEYDDRLARAGYDRSAPEVQACDSELRGLHDSIQHAKDILSEIPEQRGSAAGYLGLPPAEGPY